MIAKAAVVAGVGVVVVVTVVAGVAAGLAGCAKRDDGPWRAPAEARQLSPPVEATVTDADQKLYAKRCQNCHGGDGRGDGPGAAMLQVKPKPFADPAVQGQSDGEIYWKITHGRRPMPRFEERLSDEERWRLVKVVRTFAAP